MNMNREVYFLALLISCGSIVIGLFFFLKPKEAIELQRRFYATINWNMTPISMAKEIRNTKMMGGFVCAMGLAGLFLWAAGA
jgi:hypothetical protein